MLANCIIPVTQHHVAPLTDSLLSVLDIYNDAGQRALYTLNQQYVFREIDAEATLVLDQVVYLLSDEVYSYYKDFCAVSKLEQNYLAVLEKLKKRPYLSAYNNNSKYASAMAQRCFLFLGRTIDLNLVLSRSISNRMYDDLEVIVSSFEKSDISTLPELQVYLEVIEHTHELLSRHLALDPFQNMWSETNESSAATAFAHRVFVHVVQGLVCDIIPRHNFNLFLQQFSASPISPLLPSPSLASDNLDKLKNGFSKVFSVPVGRALDHVCKLTRSFFGTHHIQTLLSLPDNAYSVSLIVQYCLENLASKLRDLRQHMGEAQDRVPPCKLPNYALRAGVCYAQIYSKLKPFLEWPGLKTELFQLFREVGNTIAFLKELSEELDRRELWREFHDRYLFRQRSLGDNSDGVETDPAATSDNFTVIAQLQQAVRDIHLPGGSGSSSQGLDTVYSASMRSARDKVTELLGRVQGSGSKLPLRPRDSDNNNVPTSLFQYALMQIQRGLNELHLTTNWTDMGKRAANQLLEVDHPREFHRLWSAMSFAFCDATSNSTQAFKDASLSSDRGSVALTAGAVFDDNVYFSDREIFGHGIAIAGSLFLHLNDQCRHFELLDFCWHLTNVHSYDLLTSATTSLSSAAQVGQHSPPASLPHIQSHPPTGVCLHSSWFLKSFNLVYFMLERDRSTRPCVLGPSSIIKQYWTHTYGDKTIIPWDKIGSMASSQIICRYTPSLSPLCASFFPLSTFSVCVPPYSSISSYTPLAA